MFQSVVPELLLEWTCTSVVDFPIPRTETPEAEGAPETEDGSRKRKSVQ